MKPIIISEYEYAEFSYDLNNDNQSVLAIHGIDHKTLSKLKNGSVIVWNDEKNYPKNNNMVGLDWNGEVYAIFSDFVIVYLY
jgi:hypothetical protein